MISKKVLLGLLNFFLSFFPPLLGMKEGEKLKKTILFHIQPNSKGDNSLNPTFLRGCQLLNILEWDTLKLSIYKDIIANQAEQDTKKFLELITQLAKINDGENKKQIKIKNIMISSESEESCIIDNKKNKIEDSLCRMVSLEAGSFYSLDDTENEDAQNKRKEKKRPFLSRMVFSDETEENVNKVITGISTLLENIEKKGIEGVDKDVSNLVKELRETIHLLNNNVFVELQRCLEEVKNLASGVNQTQGELIDKTIPDTLQRLENILSGCLNQIDGIAKKHIDSLNENFLVNKLKSLNPKNITIAIATLASIYPFWSILRFYLNNEELKADHISKAWLWSRAGLTIFFPLIIGYLCDIIISANSNLSDFIKYNFLFFEYKKIKNNIIKRVLSFEVLLLLTSFVLLYKNFDWIQKHNILPEVILSYAFFLYVMIFNEEGVDKWKQHLGIFFVLYAILIMYKLHQAPVLDINLLKGATDQSFYRNIFFNLLALLKWNSRILITGAAPYGAYVFLKFLRNKIDNYIREGLDNNKDDLERYDFANWSNTRNQKNQSIIKPKENEEDLELIEEKRIEMISKKDIINKIIEEYTVNIKVGDSKELTCINEDNCQDEILEKLKREGLIYYYNQELLTKRKILSEKTIIEYKKEIENLKKNLLKEEEGSENDEMESIESNNR